MYDLSDKRQQEETGLRKNKKKFFVFDDGTRIDKQSAEGQMYDALYSRLKNELEDVNERLSIIDQINTLIDAGYQPARIRQLSTADKIKDLLENGDFDLPNNVEVTDGDSIKSYLLDEENKIKDESNSTFQLFEEVNVSDLWEDVNKIVQNPETFVPKKILKDIPNPSAMPTGAPAPKPVDTSPVIQRGGGSGGEKTVGRGLTEAEVGFDYMFADPTPESLGIADSDDEGEGEGEGGGGKGEGEGGSGFVPAPEIEEADVDEVYALLQEQFGGASYFFRKNAQNMQIGLTADGKLVDYNDPNATETTSLMDYIVENGITSVTRVKGLLQKTEWWQTTDRAMRAFDATWGDMSEPERAEFLEPLTDRLAKEAQFLGFELSDEEQFDLAKNLMRFGDSDDQEAIREAVLGQLQYGKMQSDISGFGAAKDAIQQLAYKYYTPIDDATAQDWAEQIYTGEATNEEYEQYLKATAVSRFPTLDKVINEMGVTPDQYFSPYKYQIEQMLGRQVNMLEEFSDVIEYMPDTGTASRPMTLSEVRKFVRATPEWQQTDDAKDQARALAFSIGQTFGEVA